MSLYERFVLPRLIALAMRNREQVPFRERVCHAAEGRVLELGIGTGLNLPFYGPNVREIVGIDSSSALLRMAEAHSVGMAIPVDLHEGSSERLPLDDGSIDTVVSNNLAHGGIAAKLGELPLDQPSRHRHVVARCSLLVARCSLLVARCSLLVARCSLLVSRRLSLAQKSAWDLASALVTCVTLFKSDSGYGAMPTVEFDGNPKMMLHAYDPFEAWHSGMGRGFTAASPCSRTAMPKRTASDSRGFPMSCRPAPPADCVKTRTDRGHSQDRLSHPA